MSKPAVRILHIVQALGYGGMESRISRLAKGLDRGRFRVEVMSLRPPVTGALDLGPDVPCHFHPIPSGLHPAALLGLAKAIRAGGYDFVHTHNWSSMFYGVLAARLAAFPVGGPLVLHGEHGLNRSDLAGIPWKRLWVQRALARAAHRIVPVNAVIAAHVRGAWGLAENRMTVIPNGVDLDRFRPRERPPGDAFTLGMVGRLDDVKDVGTALKALRLLADADPAGAPRLVLVGDGPMAASLRAQAAELKLEDRVEFAGARKDVEAFYPRFDAFLNTSVYEGMCNTLLEAMACGVPMAASAVPGNLAWLEGKGNALFFPPGDPAALADRIRELRSDAGRRAEMAERNRARAAAEFDNRTFLETYAALYENLLAARRR